MGIFLKVLGKLYEPVNLFEKIIKGLADPPVMLIKTL
jgi:hypothetical protein